MEVALTFMIIFRIQMNTYSSQLKIGGLHQVSKISNNRHMETVGGPENIFPKQYACLTVDWEKQTTVLIK